MASVEPARGAIVTGAEDAVGAAVVAQLQQQGFAVAGLDAKGSGDLPLAVDVRDRAAIVAAADRALREFGSLDVLVTAHRRHAAAPFGEMSREDWKDLLDLHLGGTVNACAAVVPHMVTAGRGVVVTTSSWLALAGVPGESYYAAATGSILAFTKSFSLEVAPKGIRVNCIAIGPLEGESAGDGAGEPTGSSRRIVPADIAATVSFLIRDGDFFAGQVFNASAGAVV